jgi:hypothetical protein
MSHPTGGVMFVYALTQPIDDFDALTPLPDWIAADPAARTRWALQAVLALTDTANQLSWDGDMRHLPSVGAVLAPPDAIPYLVVKQDNNGATFVISGIELPWPNSTIDGTARTPARPIGRLDPRHQPGHPAGPRASRLSHRWRLRRTALLTGPAGDLDEDQRLETIKRRRNSATLIKDPDPARRSNSQTTSARSHERSQQRAIRCC